jgi:hypothetical protein
VVMVMLMVTIIAPGLSMSTAVLRAMLA